MHKFPSLFVLLSLVLLVSGCSLAADITPPPGSEQSPAPEATEPVEVSLVYPIVPPDLQNGAKLYTQECASCHGTTGLGDGSQAEKLSVPVANLGLSDFSRLSSPAEWYTVVTRGSEDHFMPAFANLTDRQRWDVVAYAMKLSISDESVAQGEALYQANCLNCHGQKGQGNGPAAAGLTAEVADLSDQSFMARESAHDLFQVISSGISPEMPAYTDTLTENERWALVAYLRSLTYTVPQGAGNAYPVPSTNEGASANTSAYPSPQAYPYPAPTSTLLASTGDVTSTVPFTGTVSVQLINGSGGDVPSDAKVTLFGFDDMQNTYTETLTTGSEGLYTFTNVYMPESRVFLAMAEYASGNYGSDIVSVDPAIPDLKLQVTVYETTTDTAALSTDRAHIFFDFSDPQNVQVIEVFIISNSSKQAVVSATEDGPVVTFPLPQGYTNLQFQDGELGTRYLEAAEGFADTASVSPGMGEYQVIFAFQMPYDHKLDFIQPMYLPTGAVVVMVPENGVKIDSAQLQDSGIRDFQGTSYHMYEGSSLLAGSDLKFTLSGSPKLVGSTIFSTGNRNNLAIGLGAFGIVLLGVGVWLFRRNQLKAATQASPVVSDLAGVEISRDATPEDEETLMDAIIALDDQYHTGNLPEEAYLKRRAVLKDKLREFNT